MNCVIVHYECSVRVLLQSIYTGELSEKIILFSLCIYSHQTQAHLHKYKTMYKVQIYYSNFLDNKLFIFLNYEFFFSQAQKTNKQEQKQQDNGNQKYPIIIISNYNLKYPAISSFTVFYIKCMLSVNITDKAVKPKIFPTFFKKYEYCYDVLH